jgi:hypothetical protein
MKLRGHEGVGWYESGVVADEDIFLQEGKGKLYKASPIVGSLD